MNITIYDDELIEGLHNGTIDFSVGTSDPVFTGYTIPSVTFNIVDNDEEISIEENDKNSIFIQPSVNNGIFTVNTENISGNAILSIVNIMAQKVYEQNIIGSDTQIDLSSMPAGKYLVVINDNGAIKTGNVQIVK